MNPSEDRVVGEQVTSPGADDKKWSGRFRRVERTVNRGLVLLVAVACAAVALAVWCLTRHAALSVRVAAAREKVQVMAYATERALRAELAEAIAHLEYVTNSKGSPDPELNAIIETHKQICMRYIIERLKKLTGQDLGSDPASWIKNLKRQ